MALFIGMKRALLLLWLLMAVIVVVCNGNGPPDFLFWTRYDEMRWIPLLLSQWYWWWWRKWRWVYYWEVMKMNGIIWTPHCFFFMNDPTTTFTWLIKEREKYSQVKFEDHFFPFSPLCILCRQEQWNHVESQSVFIS